ncbi:MAG TPA: NAD(P)H-hydrate dehydratase [Clostridia bacterium]|nr:NAD(P)H-hydrate dehydratase [Clostridia bacterium]
MKLVTVEEMRSLDTAASSEYGIPSLILMENAGRAVAEKAVEYFGGCVDSRRILIFSGKGNNGGDGFVAARHLANKGADVKVFLLYPREEILGDALVNLEILEKLGVVISPVGPRDIQRVKIALIYADLVIDAIFGTGFKGKAKGTPASVIGAINESSTSVIAVDLPSGLEADSGQVKGPCIRASFTCTSGLPKPGLYLYPGVEYCGEIEVANISLPAGLIEKGNFQFSLVDREMCSQYLPPRQWNSHKGAFGHVFVAGGSVGMTGAVALASEAALKSGAGLVTACVPGSLNSILENKLTEVMSIPLPETENRVLNTEAAAVLLRKVKKNDVVAVGPGLSTCPGTDGFVKELLLRCPCPIVIDADGLNIISGNPDMLLDLKVPAVLTPHPGEMARLLGCSAQEVQQDRVNIARQFARQYGVVVVLKGANTITAVPDNSVFINTTGNPGLATAGSGDVLTGLIASLLVQGLPTEYAAAVGTYIHGLTADDLLPTYGERGITAGDVAFNLPRTIMRLEKLYLKR